MLNDEVPLVHKGPLTLQAPADSSAPMLTLNNWGSGPSIKFLGKDGKDEGQITSDGKLLDAKGKERGGSGSATNVNAAAFEAFAGEVIGGSGDTYTMHLYSDDWATIINDTDGNPKTFTVKQGKIDAAATIPIGVREIVIKRGGKYFMQVPVWG